MKIEEYDFDYSNSSLNNDYKIKSKLEFTNEYLEVTEMFDSIEELEEAGIGRANRVVIAMTPNGYQDLRSMGFTHNEIIKEYAKGKNH
jgi:hypothetical protein